MKLTPKKQEEATVDMTPMIDCVFLLIIFFMIVSEISQIDLEILTLPTADAATPDVPPEADRLIVNVVKADGPQGISRIGIYKLRGQEVAGDALKRALTREAQLDWNEERAISNRFVLIRCDRDVPYRYVQDVMMLCCSEPQIRIVKVQIAIKKDD